MYNFVEFLVSLYVLVCPFLVVRYYFYLKGKYDNKEKGE